jgi:hypothetical protein
MTSKSKLKKLASARRQKEHDIARIQKEIDKELKRFNLHPDQIKMRKRSGSRKVNVQSAVCSGIVYRETPHYPSVTVATGAYVATRYERMKYTGDKLIGIGVLHKSNLVPIFNEEHAKDMAQMRRN